MATPQEARELFRRQQAGQRGAMRVVRRITGESQIQNQVIQWDRHGKPLVTVIGDEAHTEAPDVAQAIGNLGGSVLRTFREVQADLNNPLQVGEGGEPQMNVFARRGRPPGTLADQLAGTARKLGLKPK